MYDTFSSEIFFIFLISIYKTFDFLPVMCVFYIQLIKFISNISTTGSTNIAQTEQNYMENHVYDSARNIADDADKYFNDIDLTQSIKENDIGVHNDVLPVEKKPFMTDEIRVKEISDDLFLRNLLSEYLQKPTENNDEVEDLGIYRYKDALPVEEAMDLDNEIEVEKTSEDFYFHDFTGENIPESTINNDKVKDLDIDQVGDLSVYKDIFGIGNSDSDTESNFKDSKVTNESTQSDFSTINTPLNDDISETYSEAINTQDQFPRENIEANLSNQSIVLKNDPVQIPYVLNPQNGVIQEYSSICSHLLLQPTRNAYLCDDFDPNSFMAQLDIESPNVFINNSRGINTLLNIPCTKTQALDSPKDTEQILSMDTFNQSIDHSSNINISTDGIEEFFKREFSADYIPPNVVHFLNNDDQDLLLDNDEYNNFEQQRNT